MSTFDDLLQQKRAILNGTTVTTPSKKTTTKDSSSSSFSSLLEQKRALLNNTTTPTTTKPTVSEPVVDLKPQDPYAKFEGQTIETRKEDNKSSLSFWDKYQKLVDYGSAKSAGMDIGLVKSIGSTLGSLAVIGNKILNPLEKTLDKAFGIVTDNSNKDDIGKVMNRFADHLDTKIPEDQKDYLYNVMGAIGSSLPYLAGGVYAKSLGVADGIINIGASGLEALTNAYDDYTALKEKGDTEKQSTLKGLASFGGNLVVNYLTNRLGWLSGGEESAKTMLGVVKNFAIDGLIESGQETAQQLISNITQGNEVKSGLWDTFLVSLPSSMLFGLAGTGGEVLNIKEEKARTKKVEKLVSDLTDAGATKEQVTDVLNNLGNPIYEETTDEIGNITTDKTNIDILLDEMLSNNEELAKKLDENKTVPNDTKAQELLDSGLTPQEATLELSKTISAQDAIDAMQRVQDKAKEATKTPETPEIVAPAVTTETTPTTLKPTIKGEKTGGQITTKEKAPVETNMETVKQNIETAKQDILNLVNTIKTSGDNTVAKKQAKVELSKRRLDLRNEELNLKNLQTVKPLKAEKTKPIKAPKTQPAKVSNRDLAKDMVRSDIKNGLTQKQIQLAQGGLSVKNGESIQIGGYVNGKKVGADTITILRDKNGKKVNETFNLKDIIDEIKSEKEKSIEEQATELGKKAFEDGKKATPSADKELMKLLTGLQIGEGTPIMEAWSKAWHKANLENPVPKTKTKSKKKDNILDGWNAMALDTIWTKSTNSPENGYINIYALDDNGENKGTFRISVETKLDEKEKMVKNEDGTDRLFNSLEEAINYANENADTLLDTTTKEKANPTTVDETVSRYYDEVITKMVENNEAIAIGADDLKDYFGRDYNPDNHKMYSEATNILVKKMIVENKTPVFKATIGGTGSGKSDFLRVEESKNFNGVLYDSTAWNYDGLNELMSFSEDNGKGIELYGVIPDIDIARAYTFKREANGEHPVSEKSFINTHVGAIKSMIKAIEDGYSVYVLDTRGRTKAEIMAQPYLENPLDLLKSLEYNEEYVKNKIKDITQETYQDFISRGEESSRKVSGQDRQEVDPTQKFYHGTLNDFQQFSDKELGANTAWENAKFGFFFVDDKARAETFVEETRPAGNDNPATIKEVYLDIKNPIDLTLDGIFNKINQAPTVVKIIGGETMSPRKALQYINDNIGLGEVQELPDALYGDIANKKIIQDAGYDGIISQFGTDEKGDIIKEYVAFNASQISYEQPSNDIGSSSKGEVSTDTVQVGTKGQGGVGKKNKVGLKTKRESINTPSDVGTGLGGATINGVIVEKGKQYTNEEVESIVSGLTTIEEGEVKLVEPDLITEDVLDALNQYKVGGTLKVGKGILDEYFTSSKIVDAVAQILNIKSNVKVLEPSVGSGNFVYAIPEAHRTNVNGFEINPVTAGIAKIFHQDMTVKTDSFESLFIDDRGNKKEFTADYDLAIGNPPYGSHRGLYYGLGEESGIARYENYFIKRSLDLLKENGTLAMVVPSGFLRSAESTGGKAEISKIGKLVEAWRLPNGSFDSTDVGTDIVIFQKNTSRFNDSTIINDDNYFKANPNNILGEATKKKGRFGMEDYVKGTLDEALNMFSTRRTEMLATNLLKENNIEVTEETLTEAETAVEEETGKVDPKVTVEKIKENTKVKKVIAKIKKDTIVTKDNSGREIVKISEQVSTLSKEELSIWERTNRDGYVDNPTEQDKKYLNYYKGNYYNDFNYAQGDIYEKLGILDWENTNGTIDDKKYAEQKAKLKAVLPTPETVEKLKLPPNHAFTDKVKLENGETLKSNFKMWLRELPREVFGNSSQWEVRSYVDNEQVRGSDKNVNERVRDRRKVMAEQLFQKYLVELEAVDKQTIETAYNEQYNSYHKPDFSEVPMFSTIYKDFKGEEFSLRDSQKESLGMIANRGSALVALDVGNGKTLVGVLATAEAMKNGYTKKPLWVVPNPSIAKQWIETAKDIVPNVKINNLGNLSDFTKSGAKELNIADGEITIVTQEGLKRLDFTEETYRRLGEKFKYISDDLNAYKSERDKQKGKANADVMVGKMKKGTNQYLSFEGLGFDHLTFDEVHQANHIVSKVKMDKGKATDFRSGQPYSALGIKTWLASQYIQEQNNGKNIVALSATPFTNNPLEYYSIVSLMGNKYLEKIGATNVNDFFNMFMEASSEYEVKASGKVEKKNDIRGFKNYRQWRNMLNQFSVFASQPKDIIVPDKINKSYYVPQNALQMDFNNQAQALFNDKVAGALMAVGEMRAIAFSPYISRYYNGVLSKADYKMFVEGSPKIKATMELIRQNKKDKPEAGQIIYTANTGVDTSPIMAEYLIKEVGFKPEEVGIINGKTEQGKRIQIQDDYNAGKIKVVIGSDAIQVGMELQINSTDLYIIGMPWNFTSLRQITGRIHRQNNMWKNVRINVMMSENSADVFQMQKIQNKQDRYEASIQEDAQEVDLGDINSEEMKTDLITDPIRKADFIIQQKLDLLNNAKETAKGEQAFALRKFEKLRQAQAKVDSTIKSINYEKEQNAKKVEAGREPDMYWIENYTEKLTQYKQDLQDTRDEFEAKGIDITRLDQINKRTAEEIIQLDKEITATNEGKEALVKKIISEMPELKEFSKSDVDAFVAERAEHNKTFYVKRETPTPVDVKIAKKEIKNSTGTKVVKTKTVAKVTPTVKVKEEPTVSKKFDPITAILVDKKLTAGEKVTKLLDKKQESKTFKDAGDRIAGSKKENAVIKAVMEYGNADILNSLIDEIGIDVIAGTYDKATMLEGVKLPSAEVDQKNKVPAFVAGGKLDVYRVINNKPNLNSKKGDRWSWGNQEPFEYHEQGRINSYTSHSSEASKLALKIYPSIIKEFVTKLTNAKTFDEFNALKNLKITTDTTGKIIPNKQDDNHEISHEERSKDGNPYLVFNTLIFGKNISKAFSDVTARNSKISGLDYKIKSIDEITKETITEDVLSNMENGSNRPIRGLRDGKDYLEMDWRGIGEGYNTKEEALKSIEPENKKLLKDALEKAKAEYITNYERFLPKKAVKKGDVNLEHGNFKPIETYDVGDARVPKKLVTTEHLMKTNGFKSVQFGNYMTEESAFEHIQQTIASVEDMAKIMDIDLAKFMNAKGLSIGYGARGSGKALAHYEPNRNIINITKKRGDGSFGHEFGHFLDQNMGKVSSFYKANARWISRNEADGRNLMKAIIDGGATETVTFKPQDKFDENDRNTEHLIKAKESGTTLKEAQESAGDYYSKESSYQQALANVFREEITAEIKIDTKQFGWKSEYYFNSKKIGGGKDNSYWVKNVELFARAYQSYLEDKMIEKKINNTYVTYSTLGSGAYPQGAERKYFNKLFDKVFESLKTQYPYSDREGKAIVKEEPRFKMGDETKLTMTKAGDYLVDVKKRLNIDFDTYLFDTILYNNKEALGAVYDNTMLLADYDQMTKAHETMHLVLANADRMPIFKKAGITRKVVLEAKAEQMGVKIGVDNFVEIEEQLATDFETYLAKKYQAKGIVGRFFEILRTQFAKFRRAISTDQNIMQDFFDILDEGVAKNDEMVAFENSGVISSMLNDTGVFTFDKTVDDVLTRLKDMPEDTRLSNITEEVTKLEQEQKIRTLQLSVWKTELEAEVAQKILEKDIVANTSDAVKNLARYTYKTTTAEHKAGELTQAGIDQANSITEEDVLTKVTDYLNAKTELKDAIAKTKKLRADIKLTKLDKKITREAEQKLNRDLRKRKNQVKLINAGFDKAGKQVPKIITEATKYGKTAKTYEIKNRQTEVIAKLKQLPLSKRGYSSLLNAIRNANNETKFANVMKMVDAKIASFNEARALAKDLSSARSVIGFLKHIGEMDAHLINDVKTQLNLNKSIREMTMPELKSMIEELKLRLEFKQSHGVGVTFKPMTEEQVYKVAQQSIDSELSKLDKTLTASTQFVKKALEIVDGAVGTSSTRLYEIAPILSRLVRNYSWNTIKKTGSRSAEVNGFVKTLEKIKKESTLDFRALRIALHNADVVLVNKIVEKYGGDITKTREVLAEIYEDAMTTNIDMGHLNNYFPSKVKEGMQDKLASFQRKVLESEIGLGRTLTEDEQAELRNNILSGQSFSAYLIKKIGNMKERQILQIHDKELLEYYDDPQVTLLTYITGMTQNIETRKFFGKFSKESDLEQADQLKDTIGKYTTDLVIQGKITVDQEKAVKDILRGIFNKGRLSGFAQFLSNSTYLITMNKFTNALTQVQDIGFSYSFHTRDTTTALFNALIGKYFGARDIKIKEWFLTDSAMEEISETKSLAGAVDLLFTATGLKTIDTLGMKVMINSAFMDFKRQAKKGTLRKDFIVKLENSLGSNYLQAVEDLRQGNITEEVQRLIIDDIFDYRPLGSTEKTQFFNNSNNARILYTLKQFTIKQLDIFRKRAIGEIVRGIKTGDVKRVGNGTAVLLKLTFFLILLGVAKDDLVDWILGRQTSLSDQVINNALKLIGISKYSIDNFKTKKISGLVTDFFAPVPVTAILQFGDRLFLNQEQLLRDTPFIGNVLYYRVGAGKDYAEKTKQTLEKSALLENAVDGQMSEGEYEYALQDYYDSIKKELTPQAKGQLLRTFRIAQEYGLNDPIVKELESQSTNEKKVEVLQKLNEDMGDDFMFWLDNANYVGLVSDDLLDKYYSLE